jgi:23S rRNA pseudouridine1911/1915/1917 synthase
MMKRLERTASRGSERLDLFLVQEVAELSRSQLKRLIEQGLVLVNGQPGRPGQKLRAGDRVSLTVPPPGQSTLEPEEIPLSVVYQDDELLVLDKPAGLTVHPAPGHPSGTLVNALLAICPDLRGIGDRVRPGIVHRLDKDTSGLMVVAKSHRAHLSLSRQIKERKVKKGYLALVSGELKPREGVIDAPIARNPRDRKRMAVVAGGREARTRYKVLRSNGEYSLVEAFPETGRTHQVRVHFASLGHPLVGDHVYGKRSAFLGRQFLHAHLLGFSHPDTGEWREFTSPLPPDLQLALDMVELDRG